MNGYRLKGGALYYALSISIIITTLSTLLIVFSFLHFKESAAFEEIKELERNAHSGIQLLLSDPDQIKYYKSQTVQLFEDDPTRVKLFRQPWGLYDILKVKCRTNRKEVYKTALAGSKNPLFSGSLYLQDRDKPIAIGGSTLIEGSASVPEAGFKRAYIEGKTYSRDRFVYGKENRSDNQLPELNTARLDLSFKELFSRGDEQDSIFSYSELDDYEIHNSFSGKTMRIFSEESIVIKDRVISGNVIIQSGDLIVVEESAMLSDVWILAPKVLIRSGFKGNIHISAIDTVIIESPCELLYPSSIQLGHRDINRGYPFVFIKAGSVFNGDIIVINNKEDRSHRPLLSLASNSIIQGNVYVRGSAEIKGSIHGSLVCQEFYLKTSSGIYINHLLDAEISSLKIHEYYIPSFAIGEGYNPLVAKWLN